MKFYKGLLLCVAIYIGILCINIFIVSPLKKSNKEKEMQEITVFNNYTIKLPLQAILVNTNGWKIESSSSSSTTIIASQTTQADPITSCMDIALMKYNSQKFKLSFDSQREVDKVDFKVYIKDYEGRAGVSPISFTCIILDELNTQNRFIFELNSLSVDHTYIVDSIVSSFNKNTYPPIATLKEDQDSYQIFSFAEFKVKCNCTLLENTTFIDMAKQQGVDNIIGAYICAENENDPDIGCVVNINIYDHSEEYENIPTDDYTSFEEECLAKYAQNLSSVNVTHNEVTYQGVNALQYSFEQMNIPTKAIMFYKNRKSYLLQVATRKNLDAKFKELKSSFTLIN